MSAHVACGRSVACLLDEDEPRDLAGAAYGAEDSLMVQNGSYSMLRVSRLTLRSQPLSEFSP